MRTKVEMFWGTYKELSNMEEAERVEAACRVVEACYEEHTLPYIQEETKEDAGRERAYAHVDCKSWWHMPAEHRSEPRCPECKMTDALDLELQAKASGESEEKCHHDWAMESEGNHPICVKCGEERY